MNFSKKPNFDCEKDLTHEDFKMMMTLNRDALFNFLGDFKNYTDLEKDILEIA